MRLSPKRQDQLMSVVRQSLVTSEITCKHQPFAFRLLIHRPDDAEIFDIRWFISKSDGNLSLGNCIYLNGALVSVNDEYVRELRQIGNELAVLERLKN